VTTHRRDTIRRVYVRNRTARAEVAAADRLASLARGNDRTLTNLPDRGWTMLRKAGGWRVSETTRERGSAKTGEGFRTQLPWRSGPILPGASTHAHSTPRPTSREEGPLEIIRARARARFPFPRESARKIGSTGRSGENARWRMDSTTLGLCFDRAHVFVSHSACYVKVPHKSPFRVIVILRS